MTEPRDSRWRRARHPVVSGGNQHNMKLFASILCGVALAGLPLGGAVHAIPSSITQNPFGATPDGQSVSLYTLTNTHGMQVEITNFGGTITSIKVPDKNGQIGDVALGYDSVDNYSQNLGGTYFGALIGRYGNRIARGKFTLDGKTYHLYINNGPNSLHWGKVGYNEVVWSAKPFQEGNEVGLTLHYLSKDGEEHYPGNLNITVTYTLLDSDSLRIDYEATTDKDTVVNLTNHTYFNLNGEGNGTILPERLMINADRFTPTDKTQIPTGKIESVAGTPFDFRKSTPIGARVDEPN
jgi:aldose 1-epimerase